MSGPRCLVIGTGRVAGGFLAPLLHDAGWEVVLAGRDPAIVRAINEGGGLWLRVAGEPRRWIGGVRAVRVRDADLAEEVRRADLIATAVGPSSLSDVGRLLAAPLRTRLEGSGDPVNVVTFENHRRATEILALSLIKREGSLAALIGREIGFGGAAVWRAISRREFTPEGICYDANAVDECYLDAASLVPAPPLDGSLPGVELVRSFDNRMVEKLWVFNAGHAAAAYLGWHAGCEKLDEAMSRTEIRAAVNDVVIEAQQAFESYLSNRPGSRPIPARSPDSILNLYADPALADPVIRVGREPRRKLAPGDRLIGPGGACLAAGIYPVALAGAAAAALAYAEPADRQANDLQRELELLGPEEVISAVSTLDPADELTRLISALYHERVGEGVSY
ncbi:MAG TPA: hypothetical protein VHM16_07735 [Rubrobacteraceae bacterium]|nr:hypothetical protein [Rubrobacteraceae bacterium]